MNRFEIFNETKDLVPEVEALKNLIDYALKHEQLDDVEFNIILIDNPRIQEMNHQYRGINQATDVISFALEDTKDIECPNQRLLGDIYISLDKTKEQANEYQHSFLRELSFLSIHGLLHLLGYDHMNSDDEAKMFGKQEEILNGYGIKR